MTQPTYNHAFAVAFSVGGSTSEDGSDVTPAQLKAALLKRVADLDAHDEWREAVGAPGDTYEENLYGTTQGECS